MSTQQINKETISSLSLKIDKALVKEAQNMLLYERYLLGKGEDKTGRIQHLLKLTTLLCNDTCLIQNDIERIKELVNIKTTT